MKIQELVELMHVFCKYLCCLAQGLIQAIRGIKVNCEVPQPLEITGDVTTDCNLTVPQPLEITGSVKTDCSIDIPQPLEITGSVTTTCTIPQPLEITGNINATTISSSPCTEAILKILGQSSSFTEIVLNNGEQFQKVSNVTVDGYLLTFESQGQKIQVPVCNVEYVVL